LNINTQTGWQNAELLRNGELTSEGLTKSYFERIQSYDRQLNCFNMILEQGLKAARRADEELRNGKVRSRFHGIPIGVKDVFAVRGTYTTAGSKLFATNMTDYNATVIEKLEQAGAIIIGKQNMHELARFAPPYGNPFFPPARNPWDTSRVTGGSSSGSAAATAASLCGASIGSDAGGSVRGPASFCGVVGLKPTSGRVSNYGVIPADWSLGQPGPMTRDVRDAAILLTIIAGEDSKDPCTSSEPVPDYETLLDDDVEGMRIGVPTNFYRDDVSSAVYSVVGRAVSSLEGLGASIHEFELPFVEYSRPLTSIIISCEAASCYETSLEKHPDAFSNWARARMTAGSLISAVDYIQAQRARMKITKEYLHLFKKIDVIVTATTPITAPPIGASTVQYDGKVVSPNSVFLRLTALFNLVGFPAISVPCGFEQGLPVGLQIAAAPFQEGLMLRVAHAYERKQEWRSKRPPAFS
jgi:aspartyl-tRNA(Asn)/glutamyl-tRNA(Gln) amidotransferase subunit A